MINLLKSTIERMGMLESALCKYVPVIGKIADSIWGEDRICYSIYQIPWTEDSPRYVFTDLEHMRLKGVEPNESLYNKVYTSMPIRHDTVYRGQVIKQENPELDHIFYMLNINPPKDYTARSISVSDVIVIRCKGEEQVWFVDGAGFVRLENFWNK